MREAPGSKAPRTPQARFDPAALGPLARTLTLDEAPEHLDARPLGALVEPEPLRELVEAHAHRLGDVPEPVAASSWAKGLVTVLAPGILAAWTLHDLGLDAAPRNLELHLDGTQPTRCRILDPDRVQTGRPERDLAIESLMGETIAPLFETLEATTGIGASTLWGSVGNLAAYLFDRLAETDHQGASQAEDLARLMEADEAAWSHGPNPLAGTVSYEPIDAEGLPDRYQVRTVCCLKLTIPAKDPCASCPRVSAERRRRLLLARGGGA